jgi:hypothetical protein
MGPTPRRMDWSLRSLCGVKRGRVMSSYARYCQDQATACVRRARLASSSEIVAYCRNLEFRWLRLAEQAQGTGGALGHESGLTATSFPLHDKPAAYPAEYAKRAGELIARSALSLHPLRQKQKSRRRRLKRTICEIKGGLRRLKVLMARADAGSLLARRATVVLSQHSQVL